MLGILGSTTGSGIGSITGATGVGIGSDAGGGGGGVGTEVANGCGRACWRKSITCPAAEAGRRSEKPLGIGAGAGDEGIEATGFTGAEGGVIGAEAGSVAARASNLAPQFAQ